MNFPFRQLIPYTHVAVKFLKALIHRFPTAYATCEYLKLNIHLYRAVIGTENFGMDGCLFQTVIETFRGNEVVNTPSCVLLSCLKAVGPPGINAFSIRIKMAEGIRESGV